MAARSPSRAGELTGFASAESRCANSLRPRSGQRTTTGPSVLPPRPDLARIGSKQLRSCGVLPVVLYPPRHVRHAHLSAALRGACRVRLDPGRTSGSWASRRARVATRCLQPVIQRGPGHRPRGPRASVYSAGRRRSAEPRRRPGTAPSRPARAAWGARCHGSRHGTRRAQSRRLPLGRCAARGTSLSRASLVHRDGPISVRHGNGAARQKPGEMGPIHRRASRWMPSESQRPSRSPRGPKCVSAFAGRGRAHSAPRQRLSARGPALPRPPPSSAGFPASPTPPSPPSFPTHARRLQAGPPLGRPRARRRRMGRTRTRRAARRPRPLARLWLASRPATPAGRAARLARRRRGAPRARP